jgi:hypothetical protein
VVGAEAAQALRELDADADQAAEEHPAAEAADNGDPAIGSPPQHTPADS